jgi:hypothetical protein
MADKIYNCNDCKDTGINTYVIAHADSFERVYQACPFCDKGKTIDEAKIPQHEWDERNMQLSWEERHDRVTMNDDRVGR